MQTLYAKFNKYNYHICFIKRLEELLITIFTNLIRAICILHWISRVNSCICGMVVGFKLHCWSLFRAKSSTEINENAEKWTIMQKFSTNVIAWMRIEMVKRETVQRERSREVNGFLLQYRNRTEKNVHRVYAIIASIFILDATTSDGQCWRLYRWLIIEISDVSRCAAILVSMHR